jgi:NTP pyrophosphatase (non-canonical NTP hydrolase)
MINELCKVAHDSAVEKGFYELNRTLPELCMLIVGELSEAVEAERKGEKVLPEFQDVIKDYAEPKRWEHPDTFSEYDVLIRGTIEEEIADAFIRLMDLCGFYGIDIDSAIQGKMLYNKKREKKHGKVY